MNELNSPSNLPAAIADAVLKVPKGLVPASIRALDRLVGATVDIPISWLAQQKARIDAKTEAYKLVEAAIANAAATEAGADEPTVKQAMQVLVRKEYRRQTNREAVASVMIEDLRQSNADNPETVSEPNASIDEDWLNVFERYAEDASTERMQNLWGRVLAGEIRKPGRYSVRTLRFLSEFSQAEGLLFSEFCASSFGGFAPNSLVKPEDMKDIRELLSLESVGLIYGADGFGLTHSREFNSNGHTFIREGNLALWLHGKPNTKIEIGVCTLTPLGSELLNLLPTRDSKQAARAVAHAIRTPEIQSAVLVALVGQEGKVYPMEILWQKEVSEEAAPAV